MNDIISKLIIAVVTFSLGLLGARLLRKRKVLEYDVFSMPLLRFTPKKERTLAVTVDKFLLTGVEKDKGQATPITNAYGFEINVRNVGNEEATQASVEITLHESAKIIEYETYPASQINYEVIVERVAPNILRLVVPYVNKRERFLVRVISTENEKRDCKVNIRGLGIHSRRHSDIRSGLRLIVGLTLPIVAAVVAVSLFPDSLKSLGVTETVTTTKEVTHYPAWVIVCLVVYSTLSVLIGVIWHARSVPSRTREYGSGGFIIVQDWDVDKRK